MRTLLHDFQFGIRVLRKSPGYTLLACLALALGIGANTALFSAVYGVLLKPLPYANGSRLVILQQSGKSAGTPQLGTSVRELEDYREQAKSYETLVEHHSMNFILLGRQPDKVRTGVVSANFFDVLGVKPLMGRFFSPDEEKLGANPVLVLSYKYWQQNQGGDPNIIGKAFKMNDRMHTVIGVLPPIPQYPQEEDVYMAVPSCPFRSNPTTVANRNARLLNVFGVLKPGVTLAAANAEAATIAQRFTKEYPQNYANIRDFSTSVDSLQNQLTQRARPMLIALLATAGLVLLISCANVANLALARMTQREYEMAVRMSLGAPRSRLIQQILTECTILSVAGGLLGLLFASVGTKLLATFLQQFTTRAAEIKIDTSVLLFTLGISVVTGILFGLAPALSSSRRVTAHVQTGGRSIGVTPSRLSLRNALIMAQVGISFMLLVIAGLTLRSFSKLQAVDAGFNAENVVTMQLPVNFSKFQNPQAGADFNKRILDRVRELPGVTSAAYISGLPMSASPFLQPVDIENRAQDPNAPRPDVDVTIISDATFKTMGIPLLRGRDFELADTPEKPGVAILSAATAKRYWEDGDPVGHRISLDRGKTWLTIVGVSGDVKFFGLDKDAIDEVYIYSGQNPSGGNLLVRSRLDAGSVGQTVTAAVHGIDPEQPVTDITTLAQIRADSLNSTRVTSMLLGGFAILALLLASTGIFAVISFLVGQRTREIGIRIALGARASSVLAMIVGQGMQVVIVGLVVGFLGALFATGVVKTLLYGVTSTDWITYSGVALLLVVTSLLATLVPARRASKVDPMVALRYE